MGYPPSGRGYRVHSLATNHFFDSGNVIFDENIPYHALHEVSATPIDYSSLPLSNPDPPASVVPSHTLDPMPSSPTSSPTLISPPAPISAPNFVPLGH